MPDPSAATPLSTPKQTSTFLTDATEEENDGKEQYETDDQLRQIILMTSIWVVFKEGWSPSFKYDDKEKEISGLQRSPSLPQNSPARSATFSSIITTPPGSPEPTPLEKRNSIKSVSSSVIRRSTLLGRGNRNSAASVPEGEEPVSPEAAKKTGRGRADSASTVLVHRAASNRAKHHQATWRPDLLSMQHETPESSPKGLDRINSTPNTGADAAFDAAPSPSPQRWDSIARPLLPHWQDSGSQDGASNVGLATPRSVGQAASPEKRESSTTTATASSVSEVPRKPTVNASDPAKKKRGGWRRLLCGSGHDV